MAKPARLRRGQRTSRPAGPPPEEIEARAARLGITRERVLEEMRRIAFSDLSRIADWRSGEDGLQVKPSKELDEADAAAVAEIVASASTGKIYRIKMHDKTPGLVAVARCLGMFPKAASAQNEDEPTQDEIDSARERLIDALDRLAAEAEAGMVDPEAPP